MQNKSLYGGFGVNTSSARPKGASEDVVDDEEGARIPEQASDALTQAKGEEAKEALKSAD